MDGPRVESRPVEGREPCPLPDDPVLAEAAVALNAAGQWAEIVDRNWRLVYTTDDLRLAQGAMLHLASVPLGAHYYSAEAMSAREQWRIGPVMVDVAREGLAAMVGAWMLADTAGGRKELRELVDPRLRDIVDEISPTDRVFAESSDFGGYGVEGSRPTIRCTAVRIRDGDGRLAGTALISKPAPSMSVLATLAAQGDLRHFERMQSVAKAGRRPAAILFADLEASSPLARRLSTASYFSLGRRMTRAADQCVIDAGGLVGRHVGDGVVAFFLAETAGSESAAARACIQAARAVREVMIGVAGRSELVPDELVMRFGLHWGATLYVGQIATSGRAEVTALGDEVNEGARIEACATGGRALASKELLERLEPADATALGLDPDHLTYTPLADLPAATEKARRDAPAIAVCEV
jgi:class 3 adenylate cyclase